MLRNIVAAIACTSALAGFAQHPPEHAKPRAPRASLGASVASDAAGRLYAVYKEGEHVMLRRSADRGVTWSTPVAVNAAPEVVVAGGDSRPHIALGAGSDIYVSWMQSLGRGHTGYIRFARSTDAGRSFAEPMTVHVDRQLITHAFDSLAVDSEGKVFIAWIDNRDAKAAGSRDVPAAVYYAVSDDRGASFRGDFRAAVHSCDCCRIALLPETGGGVLAFWRGIFAPNIRDHALATLGANGAAGTLRRATFDDWRVDACPHQGPSLARGGQGALHAVWFSGTPGKEGVYYGRLKEASVEGQRRIGGDTAGFADVAADGKHVAIAWKEFDGTRSVLRASRSDDGGTTWRDVQLATSAGATDQPRVLAQEGDFLVFWNSAEEPLRVVALP